jgi:hypothetical protein
MTKLVESDIDLHTSPWASRTAVRPLLLPNGQLEVVGRTRGRMRPRPRLKSRSRLGLRAQGRRFKDTSITLATVPWLVHIQQKSWALAGSRIRLDAATPSALAGMLTSLPVWKWMLNSSGLVSSKYHLLRPTAPSRGPKVRRSTRPPCPARDATSGERCLARPSECHHRRPWRSRRPPPSSVPKQRLRSVFSFAGEDLISSWYPRMGRKILGRTVPTSTAADDVQDRHTAIGGCCVVSTAAAASAPRSRNDSMRRMATTRALATFERMRAGNPHILL